MNIHVLTQTALRWKTFLTFITCIHIISSACFPVSVQTTFTLEPFVTHCTHIWCWIVIMWMFSDIIIVSFNLYLKRTCTCIYISQHDMLLQVKIVPYSYVECWGSVADVRTRQTAHRWLVLHPARDVKRSSNFRTSA